MWLYPKFLLTEKYFYSILLNFFSTNRLNFRKMMYINNGERSSPSPLERGWGEDFSVDYCFYCHFIEIKILIEQR